VCRAPAEYCSRGSLAQLLADAQQDASLAAELSWRRRLIVALQTALGMLYLHSRQAALRLGRWGGMHAHVQGGKPPVCLAKVADRFPVQASPLLCPLWCRAPPLVHRDLKVGLGCFGAYGCSYARVSRAQQSCRFSGNVTMRQPGFS